LPAVRQIEVGDDGALLVDLGVAGAVVARYVGQEKAVLSDHLAEVVDVIDPQNASRPSSVTHWLGPRSATEYSGPLGGLSPPGFLARATPLKSRASARAANIRLKLRFQSFDMINLLENKW
jgi:hypothetical protein